MGVFDEKAVDILHQVRNRWRNGGEVYIGRVDVVFMPDGSMQYQAVFSYGAANDLKFGDHPTWNRFNTLPEATAAVERVLRQYRERGYQQVGSPGYKGNLTWEQCLAKIDLSLTVGFVKMTAKPASTPASKHGGRAKRNVQI